MPGIDLTLFMANALGAIATALYLYSDIQEDDALLDRYFTIGNVVFLGHLFLIGSYIPCVTVALSVLRNVINKRYPESNIVKYTFVGIFSFILVACLLLTDEWQNALPAAAALIMTFAFLYTSKNMLTLLTGLVAVLWILIGIFINSMPIIILEIISIFLLMLRAYKQNKVKNNQAAV